MLFDGGTTAPRACTFYLHSKVIHVTIIQHSFMSYCTTRHRFLLIVPKFLQWRKTTLAFCSYPLDSLCYDSLNLVWVKSQAECFPLNDIPPCLPIPTGLSREAELTNLRLSNQAGQQRWSTETITGHMCSIPLCPTALCHRALGMCKNLRPIVPISTFGWFVQSK